ncbi:MAG: T9SS type A sorting domain-containing protein [Bacteroidales bacterium]|nr:T9SS type A sorting domain-containing protein [Bacteroidales bacterium]
MNNIKAFQLYSFILPIIILLLQNVEAQEIVFDNTYGFADYSAGKSIVQLSDSGYAFMGSTGFAEGNSQLLFVRLDKNGVPLHFRQTADADKLYDGRMMRIAANGDYLVTGTLRDGTQPYAPFCMRIDTSFNIIWNTVVPANDWAFGNSLIELPDGSIAVAGETYDTDSTGADALFLRFSPNGDLMAKRASGLPGNDGYNSLETIDSASLLVAGFRKSTVSSDTVPFFASIDFDGNVTNLRSFEEYKTKAVVNHAIMDSRRNIVCVGYTMMYDTLGYSDFFMTTFDTAGNYIADLYVDLPMWAGADDLYKSVGVTPEGNIFAAGTCAGNNYLQPSILVHLLDKDYNWEDGTVRTGHDVKKSDVLSQLVTTSDGGCIMIGTTTDLGSHIADIFIFKLGQKPSDESPIQHYLPVEHFDNEPDFEIYPNPVSNFAHISWKEAPQGKTQISVYDMAAHKLLSLEHDFSIAPDLTLHLPDIPYGNYILGIQNGRSESFRKIVITH